LAIRQSLINTSFHHYNELIKFLKALPVHQGIPGMTQAFLQIDGAMLWIKEILLTTPIVINPPVPEPAPESDNVTQDHCVEEIPASA
jgi:hypothetical protein